MIGGIAPLGICFLTFLGGPTTSERSAAAVQGTVGPAVVPQSAPASQPYVTILNEDSLWRRFDSGGDPFVRMPDGTLTRNVTRGKEWGSQPVVAPLPPADWVAIDFDDGCWMRRCIADASPHRLPNEHTRGVRNGPIFIRRRFEVKDPAQVDDLRLSLAYYGGAIVHVNGQELARGHMASPAKAGETPGLDAPAEDYPLEASVTPEGKPLRDDDKKNADRLALRERKMDVTIASSLLRKGANVLAIDVRPAPVRDWWPCALLGVKLMAPAQAAVVANTTRPDGVQVWNSPPWETVDVFHYGDPLERLRPIRIVAARNGAFSGRLVVSSGQVIKGLHVSVTDLVHEDKADKIPASAVRLRCAQPWVPGEFGYDFRGRREGFDGLLDEIPSSAAVDPNKVNGKLRGFAPGAVAPLWFTVQVPKDAKPGAYEGAATVTAEGLAATTVPLKVTVSDWVAPEPKDFRTSVCGWCLPEGLARHYNVPRWSERHFELMGKSLALMADLGSRNVIVNLAVDWYGLGGNEESEVRWITQPDEGFKHDFRVFDKHLDVVAKSIGKPLALRLNCWSGQGNSPFDRTNWAEDTDVYAARNAGFVTTVEPATGKLGKMKQPCPGTPESLAFWKPVLDEIRRKVEARGWWDVTCLGHADYVGGMPKDLKEQYAQIWPDGLWAYTCHGTSRAKGLLTVEACWTIRGPRPRGYRQLLDPNWTRWKYYAARNGPQDWSPLHNFRLNAEKNITSGLDGNQLGADIFSFKPRENNRGNRYTHERCGRSGCGPEVEGNTAILAPGVDGPIVTERFEMFREGVVVAEAVLFLARAIEEKKVGEDLARRVSQCLDERDADLSWYISGSCTAQAYRYLYSRIQERDARLFEVAGEVARAMQQQ